MIACKLSFFYVLLLASRFGSNITQNAFAAAAFCPRVQCGVHSALPHIRGEGVRRDGALDAEEMASLHSGTLAMPLQCRITSIH